MSVSLVVLAAGLSTRYGRLKQLDPVGPSGEALMDYGIFDAVRAGVGRVVPVVREEIAAAVGEHVRSLVGDGVEVVPAIQAVEDAPPWFAAPEEREKPWGTGHAVLAARHAVDGPFLVMNADDLYGREAFRRLVGWAAERGEDPQAPPPAAALVPYRLRESLSAHGGVSRGILRVDEGGTLQAIREVFRIRERDSASGPGAVGLEASGPEASGPEASGPEASALVGEARDGSPLALSGEELFSANLWGFGPEVLPLLEEGFAVFLRKRGREADAEFLVADGLRPALAEGRLRVRVLERGRTWLGVTHPDDRPAVAARLREMVEGRAYPPDLRAARADAPGGRDASGLAGSPPGTAPPPTAED